MGHRHRLGLLAAIALGAVLRFWQLAAKPLWLDEILTTLFSLGQGYGAIPLENWLSLAQIQNLFQLNPAATHTTIAQLVATQSTHPPLFFCVMHQWLVALHPDSFPDLVWQVRTLPALFGLGAIGLVYLLNRVAFSPQAALWGAGLMAVSPFAVYLSQEARHYTLPMCWVLLALWSLLLILRRWQRGIVVPLGFWLVWVAVNSLGLYTHYFFALALGAQIIIAFGYGATCPQRRDALGRLGLAIGALVLSYLPWLPILLTHLQRGETDWLQMQNPIAPLYQTLLSGVVMVVALPVEHQPLGIAIPAAIVMVGVMVWVIRRAIGGFREQWSQPERRLSLITIGGFVLIVWFEFLGLAYGLGKDLTAVPRYTFVYYPALCALLGGILWPARSLPPPSPLETPFPSRRSPQGFGRWFSVCLFSFAVISSLCVNLDLAFTKPFQPRLVAAHLSQEPDTPILVVTGYQTVQEVALGLSFALALADQGDDRGSSHFSFMNQRPSYAHLWQRLAHLPPPLPDGEPVTQNRDRPQPDRLNLWAVSPGLRRREYPEQLSLFQGTLAPQGSPEKRDTLMKSPKPTIATEKAQSRQCRIDPSQHYRIGIPYQLYRCQQTHDSAH